MKKLLFGLLMIGSFSAFTNTHHYLANNITDNCNAQKYLATLSTESLLGTTVQSVANGQERLNIIIGTCRVYEQENSEYEAPQNRNINKYDMSLEVNGFTAFKSDYKIETHGETEEVLPNNIARENIQSIVSRLKDVLRQCGCSSLE